MAKKDGTEEWVIETRAPYFTFMDPMLNPQHAEHVRIYEETGSNGLAEKYPAQDKKFGPLTPHKLFTDEMYKNTKPLIADDEGTMRVSNDKVGAEEIAVKVYMSAQALRKDVCYNEKFGLPMPTTLKRKLEQAKKEQDDIQRLILRGGLGSRR
jgi:hypothetical protein